MNSKLKSFLSIFIFALFIIVAYFAYVQLSGSYKPESNQQINQNENQNKTKAPDFTVLDTNGNEVKLSSLFGKPLVLNFWASWCPPCKGEMPHFNKVYQSIKGKVNFMMVDLTDGQRETLKTGKNYIKENGFTFPVYFDTRQEAANAYGIESIPSTFIIDKDGYIVTRYQGAIDEKTLTDGIKLINK